MDAASRVEYRSPTRRAARVDDTKAWAHSEEMDEFLLSLMGRTQAATEYFFKKSREHFGYTRGGPNVVHASMRRLREAGLIRYHREGLPGWSLVDQELEEWLKTDPWGRPRHGR